MKIGIDAIDFYTPHYTITSETLATARNIEVAKLTKGLGVHKMTAMPPDEDIVTMGANAAESALEKINKSNIDMILFATESGIDQSKSAGLYIHELLNFPPHCRVIELKQACYSATAAIRMAMGMVMLNERSKILVIASDNARYGLKTPGEPTQGCASVAMVISKNPRILTLDNEYGLYAESNMDFWRPNYRDAALVDGKKSLDLYMKSLENSWREYQLSSSRNFSDHAHYCYHTPFPKMAEKAHQHLSAINNIKDPDIAETVKHSLQYSRLIGNSYTASLYLCLTSLLENNPNNLAKKRIGLYSYGSGCVGEYFSGTVEPGYKKHLNSTFHQELLANRKELTIDEYEDFYNFEYPKINGVLQLPHCDDGNYHLEGLSNHMRIYKKSQEEKKRKKEEKITK